MAETYYKMLNKMPPMGSIGEALVKQWVIRQRLIDGFAVWQTMLASGLANTDAYLLSADAIGELVSNIFLVKPGHIPGEWTNTIDRILKEAQFTVDKEAYKAAAKADPNTKDVFVAERYVDPQTAMKAVNAWGDLEDEYLVKKAQEKKDKIASKAK